jgi:hypothetical protein
VVNRQSQLGIGHLAPLLVGAVEGHHHQPAIDLLPPIHPRGVLLADVAALGERDAVQFCRIGFEPQHVAELGAAFGHADPEPVREVGRIDRLIVIGYGRDPALA